MCTFLLQYAALWDVGLLHYGIRATGLLHIYGYSCLSPGIIKVTRYDRRWGGSRDIFMMTSSNGNIFRVTGHLFGEVTGEFPTPRPVTHSFDLFFDLRLYKQLSKQSWGWWFETSSRPLWRHCNVFGKFPCLMPQQKKLFICKLCSGKSTWTKWFFSNYNYKDTTCFIFSLDWHQPNGRGTNSLTGLKATLKQQ